jgi:hypothetical protein
MNNHNIGKYHAELYIQWAKRLIIENKKDEALEVLRKGRILEAQPLDELMKYQEKVLNTDETATNNTTKYSFHLECFGILLPDGEGERQIEELKAIQYYKYAEIRKECREQLELMENLYKAEIAQLKKR